MEILQHTVESLPNPLPLLLKTLGPRPGFKEGSHIPRIGVSWSNFTFTSSSVLAYAKACSADFDGEHLPLLYPHSFFGPLHLLMLTDANFPLKVLGGIHQRNHVIQHRTLTLQESYDAQLFFTEERRRPQGLEIDFRSEIRQGSTLCWESTTTFLFRKKFKIEDPDSPLAHVIQNISDPQILSSFPVPALTGKVFGWVTKDINPIHMSKFLAKLFGFERDLCHGMWALSRSLKYVEGIDWLKPLRIDAIFKGPLYMERDITIKTSKACPQHFELYSGSNSRPCQVVKLQNVLAGDRL